MTTNYSDQIVATKSSRSIGEANTRKSVRARYQITDSGPMAANSVVYMVKIPKGAALVGGRVFGDPIDSSGSGSALMSIHVGLDVGFTAGDGTVYGSTTATACLVSSLAMGPNAAAVAGYKATNTVNMPFGGLVVTNGPLITAAEGMAYITFTASALALTTGYIGIEVDYYQAVLS